MDIEFYILSTQSKIEFTYHSGRLAKTQRWVGCSKFGSKFFFLTGDALWPKITDNFLDILTLEGAGHQIVDTRPIFGL